MQVPCSTAGLGVLHGSVGLNVCAKRRSFVEPYSPFANYLSSINVLLTLLILESLIEDELTIDPGQYFMSQYTSRPCGYFSGLIVYTLFSL